MFLNALLVIACAVWYYNAVWMPQSGSPDFATKQRRAALRAYGMSMTAPVANQAFVQGTQLGLSFTLASARPANSTTVFVLTKGTSVIQDISNAVSCTTDSAALVYTCGWTVPQSVNIGSGYTILASISNTAWMDTTNAFTITSRQTVLPWSVSQTEITTISANLPSDVTYTTYDLEVHRALDNYPQISGHVDVTEAPIFTIASGQNATNGYVSYTWTVPLNLVNTTDGYSVWVWAYTKAQDATTRVLVRVGSMVQVQALNLASAYPNQKLTIAFPGSGDMWRTGTNDSISFDFTPASASYSSFNADVYATDPNNPLYYSPLRVLSGVTNSKRSFTFPVPKTIQQGNYFIYVWGFQNGASTGVPMGGKGGVFLTYGSVAPSSAASILSVSAPAANNILYKGDQIMIQWSAGMALTYLDFFLDFVTNTSSSNVAKIASNVTANTNNWKWVIPLDTPSHKFYSIRVQGTQSVTQGSGVFTGVSYPITIMARGENANNLDQGSTINNDLAASSGTGSKGKSGSATNVGGGAQTLKTISFTAGSLLMVATAAAAFI